MPKWLDQIQCQAGPVGRGFVVHAQERVQAPHFGDRGELVGQEGIPQTEERIDRIFGRAS